MMRPVSSYAITNGWHQDDYGDWRYYVDDEYLTGWQKIDGQWFFFEEWDGHMYKDGVNWVNGNYYYFNSSGWMQGPGWIKEVTDYGYTNWYYANNGGTLVTGWQKIGGQWYYFDHRMYSNGSYTINDKLYRFNDKGHMLGSGGGWIREDHESEYSSWTEWYYANKDGSLLTGWQQIDGKRFYFNQWDGRMYSDGTHTINDKMYYFNDKGHMLGSGGGWIREDHEDEYSSWTNWYYANKDGSLVTEWQQIDGKWFYFNEYDGHMYSHSTYTINDKKYRFNDKGHMLGQGGGWIKTENYGYTDWNYANTDGSLVTGWKQIGGKWYYFEEWSGSMVADQSYRIDGKYYYFNENGHMQGADGGWIKVVSDWGDTYWYYANKGGSLVTGWKNIGGKDYYFGPEMASNTAREIDGKFYAFDEGGLMLGANGGWVSLKTFRYWYDSNGKEHKETGEPPYWFYAEKGGSLVTGWRKISDTWYYFDPYNEGQMARGTVYTDNGTYQCAQSGALLGEAGGWTKVEFTNVYYDGTGKRVTEKRDYWIYTEKGGKVVENGWKTISGKTYYFEDGIMAKSANKYIDEKYYIFDENGALSKGGWVKGNTSGGKTTWYYANSDGTAKEGWHKIDGKWYLFRAGRMVRGSAYDEKADAQYILQDNGVLSSGGWVSIATSNSALPTMYYANTNGTAVTGWKQISGKWYYFSNYSGSMFRNDTYYIDGKKHKFGLDGVWISEV